MASNNSDNNAKKICMRNWTDIAEEWTNYLPLTPFEAPIYEVEELTSLSSVYSEVKKKRAPFEYYEEVDQLRTAMYSDSIQCLLRSINIFNTSLSASKDGFRTWSRAIAYQSAFFAMRSILSLTGCAILRQKSSSKHFQVDIWATPNGKPKQYSSHSTPFVIRVHQRNKPTHKDYWNLFIRTIRVVAVDNTIWPYELVTPITKVPSDEIATQRNNLQYKASSWVFGDLMTRDSSDNYDDLFNTMIEGRTTTIFGESDFYISFSIQLTCMAIALFESIKKYGGMSEDEWNQIKSELVFAHSFVNPFSPVVSA